MSIIREQIAAAVGASDLSSNLNYERPVDRIGALATVGFNRGDDGAVSSIDPNSVLGSMLVRLRYARDRKSVKPAVHLLAQEIRRMKDRKRWKLGRDVVATDTIITKLATAAIAEWIEDKCGDCLGRGRTGLSPEAVDTSREQCRSCRGAGGVDEWTRTGIDLLLHGDHDGQVASPVRRPCGKCGGAGQVTNRIPRKHTLGEVCITCGGSGDKRVTAAQRAIAIGVPIDQYEKNWAKCYAQVVWRLCSLDGYTIAETLLQLEKDRNTLPPQQSDNIVLNPSGA